MNNYFNCTKDCPNRRPACHDGCEKYQTARKRYLQEQKEIQKKRSREAAADTARRDAIKRCIRSKKGAGAKAR